MSIRDLMPFGKRGLQVRREDDPFALLQREMNELFENFFRGVDVEPFGSRLGTFSPRIDVMETDKEIKISAELPGMDEKDIDVSMSKDALTIRGEKKEEKEDKGKDYYRMERSYGSFTRTIPLPREIDSDKIDATFKKGVLMIVLPKTEKEVAETKKISVSSE